MALPRELHELVTATHHCVPLFGTHETKVRKMSLSVFTSLRGAYLGHHCRLCAMISRKTAYMKKAEADQALRAVNDASGETPLPKSFALL